MDTVVPTIDELIDELEARWHRGDLRADGASDAGAEALDAGIPGTRT